MPCSHLLRVPCDKWIYDFPYDFSGIVAGYGLRHMCSHCMRASCEYLYGHLATCRAKPYGGCAKIVRKSCDAGAVAMQSPQIPHGNRTSLVRAVQRPCRDGAVTLRGPYDNRTIFFPNDHLKSCDFRKISTRLLHDARTMLLRRATGLRFFSNLSFM